MFGLFKNDEYKQNKLDEELEKEMSAYSLNEFEKDLVRKGYYNTWDFEEEELCDDDYYNEDV